MKNAGPVILILLGIIQLIFAFRDTQIPIVTVIFGITLIVLGIKALIDVKKRK